MALELRPFDAADYLDGPEEAVAFLNDALESGDAGFVSDAIGVVARARGMTQLAEDVGVSRQSLYRSLSADGHPEFATVIKVLSALGVTLVAKAAAA